MRKRGNVMGREIKFRAWDKKEKIMYEPQIINLWVDFMGDIYCFDGNKFSVVQDSELIQYTGLKDKNGKEIFESDIYHMGDRNITYTVVWHDTGLIGKQNSSSSYAGLEHWRDRIEVIGNIYENPELLEV